MTDAPNPPRRAFSDTTFGYRRTVVIGTEIELIIKGRGGSGRVGRSGPARGGRVKVTPEPRSLHGDFPET